MKPAQGLRWAASVAFFATGGLALARAVRRLGPPSVLILRYHRVLGADTANRFYRLGIPEDVFRAQVGYLRRHYEILDLETAVDRLRPGAPPAAGLAIVITFDDGYADNLATARWLRREGVPVTIFVTSGPVDEGRPFFWERLAVAFERAPALASAGPDERRRRFDEARARVKALPHGPREEEIARITRELGHEPAGAGAGSGAASYPQLELPDDRPLTWDEVRQLAAAGVRLGGHTITHPLLTRLADDDARAEIAGGQEAVARCIGGPASTFAYPTGDVDERIRRITAEAGVAIALTCASGANRPGADPLLLRRKGVGELLAAGPGGRFSPALWGAEIEGGFDALRRVSAIRRLARQGRA